MMLLWEVRTIFVSTKSVQFFLQKIKGGTMFKKHRNTAIRESLDVESLLFRIERYQLRWFGRVSRMP